jgi:hypothetical protein
MYTYKIYHNNELKKTFENEKNDFCVFGYMLKAQSNSVSHAIIYEGWKVEIINEDTKEIKYLQAYY